MAEYNPKRWALEKTSNAMKPAMEHWQSGRAAGLASHLWLLPCWRDAAAWYSRGTSARVAEHTDPASQTTYNKIKPAL